MRLLFFLVFAAGNLLAQLGDDKVHFTEADSLRGSLRPERTSFDVLHYHLDITVDPDKQFVSGTNTMTFRVVEPTSRIQVDLFENMALEKILYKNKPLKFERKFGAVFIEFPSPLKTASTEKVVLYFSGNPIVAVRPPWDGGFIWTKDKEGNPWVAVACQGTGASLWWPNKDHQADEVDSMLISVTVPKGLMNVSNGRFRGSKTFKDGSSRWDWGVTYPINNYNVTVNIGKFAHFSDMYNDLSLDYYVMPEDLDKAKEQFKQVKPMMECFEKRFGPYPFKHDGYKLVQSPHLGMEHQSAVAYGNKYLNGYLGSWSSPEGILFDFIIIHESAHEWWGNSVTSKDLADMWIHEGFGAYAEAVYVECQWGYEAGQRYQNGKKQDVRFDKPIIGPYDVNQEGSGDMYAKGSFMLNTLRHAIGNDQLWFDILKGIHETYKYKTIHTDTIVNFVNRKTGKDWTSFFDQYLKHIDIPTLNLTIIRKGKETKLFYKWQADVENFDMPVRISTKPGTFQTILPTTKSQTLVLGDVNPEDIEADESGFFIHVKKRMMYQDEKVK